MEKIARVMGKILSLIIVAGIVGFVVWAFVVYVELPDNYLLEVFCFALILISGYATAKWIADGLMSEIDNEIKNKRKEEKEG